MRIDHRLVHPKFQPYLDRFILRSVANSLQCSIAKRDLEITHREVMARAARKKLTRKVGGVITVRDLRARVTKRVETEVEKARRALDRAETAELKKENARKAAQNQSDVVELSVDVETLRTLSRWALTSGGCRTIFGRGRHDCVLVEFTCK